jgi:hypothetical protein
VLAYHLLCRISKRLEGHNDTRDWQTIRRLLGTHSLVTVSGHFKMHHLWSLQSAPPLTGVFLGFLGSFWQGVFLFP